MNDPDQEADIPSKADRLREVFRRLDAAPVCSTFEEAYQLLCDTMNQVEDELTPYPNEPDRWRELDRLFPPQTDRMSVVKECRVTVRRFDSRGHLTYIAENGAMEFRTLWKVEAVFSKNGIDGRTVCEVCSALQEKNL